MRPLQAIFERPVAVGCYRQVFVLTDGAVSNTEAVIALVRRHAIQSRVFSIGIGATVSRALVEGLARAAGTLFLMARWNGRVCVWNRGWYRREAVAPTWLGDTPIT